MMTKIDTRLKEILCAIIQSHIDLNIPIGSMLIAQRFPVGLSPATVRSTMAKLEEMGYITQPHRSAGRVPTEKGYRFYVDYLMGEQTLCINSDLTKELSDRLSIISQDSDTLINAAARTLSLFSRYLAIATPPKIDDILLKRIKFIKYENKKILVVIISDEGVVKNKIIELDKIYTQKHLDMASNKLNCEFSGLTIKKVREKIAYQLYKEKTVCDQLVANLLYLCNTIIPPENDSLYLNGLSGTSNLPDFATMKQIKNILRAIEDKRFMLQLLQLISKSNGTRVFVGMENIFPPISELSMVISTYSKNKFISGAVGIIGPTRMNYKKMIPIVDHTAKALSRKLSET
ncbi:MAG: heat-inducible transcription repressor HrcA [Nitrospirae bacterium]|nr:heat-inducible transcription repressor HrcA [Nitrospirota bacterium]